MGSSWKRQGVEEPFCHDDRRMGEHTFLTFSSSVRNSLIKWDKFCQPTRGQAVDPRLSLTKRNDLLVLEPGGTLRPSLGRACKEMADVHRVLQPCANRTGRWPNQARSP